MKIKKLSGNVVIEGQDANLCYVRTDKLPSADYSLLILTRAELLKTKTNSFVIETPGEYEVKDILVTAIETEAGSKLPSTYAVDIDAVSLLFLGPDVDTLTKAQIEQLGEIHIVICEMNMSKIAAQIELVSEIDPTIFIPIAEDKELTTAAVKEIGTDLPDPQASLNVKAADFADSEQPLQVVLLS